MSPLVIVLIQVRIEPLITIGSAVVLLEIDLFIFHSSPMSFYHHIVNRAAFAIHADRHIL